MINSRILTILVCCFLLINLTACNDDDECPTCPADNAAEPTMANIWPHDDGNSWTFDMAYKEYEAEPEAIAFTDTTNPEGLPSMAALHAELQMPLPETPAFSADAVFRFALDGEVVTETGVTAQRVVESLYLSEYDKNAGRSVSLEKAPARLLRLVAQNRPDLRHAILPQLDQRTKGTGNTSPPFLLGGYAFAAEDSGYFSYGDVDANHSWIYLDSSLETGTEFSLQLLASITDDIWLFGQIWSRGDLTVNGRQYENVVECMYLIDMGEQEMVDEEGNPLGTFHPHTYGTIHFAPEVGPIRGLERHRPTPGPDMMGGDFPSVIDWEMNLSGIAPAQ